jgi:hypothetical protein
MSMGERVVLWVRGMGGFYLIMTEVVNSDQPIDSFRLTLPAPQRKMNSEKAGSINGASVTLRDKTYFSQNVSRSRNSFLAWAALSVLVMRLSDPIMVLGTEESNCIRARGQTLLCKSLNVHV